MEDPGNNQLKVATGDRLSTVELITYDPRGGPANAPVTTRTTTLVDEGIPRSVHKGDTIDDPPVRCCCPGRPPPSG
jgi:hypothetical protein